MAGTINDMDDNTTATGSSGPMTTNSPMTLRRAPDGKMIAGVCSGLQRQFGWDANILRLIWAVATFITGGTAAIVYAIAWLLIPEEGRETSIAQDLINKNTHR
jgi:phage shock protein C